MSNPSRGRPRSAGSVRQIWLRSSVFDPWNGKKTSLITTGISSHVRSLLEEKSVPLLSKNIDAMVCFFFSVYLSSKQNRKFKHLVQTKPTGENTMTNIMKVSVAGTSLKESEKERKKVSDISTTVAPLTYRWQRRKKTNCPPHFRVLNLKNFSMNPVMMRSQEQTMMNSR